MTFFSWNDDGSNGDAGEDENEAAGRVGKGSWRAGSSLLVITWYVIEYIIIVLRKQMETAVWHFKIDSYVNNNLKHNV